MDKSITTDSSGAVPPARIPRENGYGDFCFGRLTIKERMKRKEYKYFNYEEGTGVVEHMDEWTEQEIMANSGNARFVELDGFERYVHISPRS